MALTVYNTMTRKKELFTPLREGKVSMYMCGVTVYDLCHIGHARAYIVFDVIRRYFAYRQYDVTYIQNFTDVDDKIIKRAAENGEDPSALAERFIDEYFTDADTLKIQRATDYPRATAYIGKMHELIGKLIEAGKAYAVEGEVYFDVTSFTGYGKLSGRDLEDNEAGARIEVNEAKRNPFDFALWKKVPEGELSWDSPWGPGRPGWHLECSVMSMDKLGESFDIHGGGQDLVFPHHENEIAQSEAATGKPYAKYWMHNGFVRIDNEKMSKSLGNFFTVREVLKKYSPEVLRLFMVSTHYRSPINYSTDQLDEAGRALERLVNAVGQPGLKETGEAVEGYRERFEQAMDDDFNTAEAVGILFEMAKKVNITRSAEIAGMLKELAGILAVLPEEEKETAIPEDLKILVLDRRKARKNKDFDTADRIRDELAARKVTVKDTAEGSEVTDTASGIRWLVEN